MPDSTASGIIIPKTFRVLDISTSHIAETDTKFLSEPFGPRSTCLITREYEEGWWVHINHDDKNWLKDLKELGYPESILAVLEFALLSQCDYVFIDRDGEVYEHLSKYEW